MPLYDEDGNAVELSSLDEFKALEEKASKIEGLETTLGEKEAELKKYADKEFNFGKLRGKNKEEIDSLTEGWSEEKKEMANEMNNLRGEVEEYHTATLANYEEDVLNALAGEDVDLRDKIKERAKEFVGVAKTKKDMLKRYKDSYTLLKGSVPTVNPINQFQPTRGSNPAPEKGDKFTQTERGKAAYNTYFPKNTYKEDNQ